MEKKVINMYLFVVHVCVLCVMFWIFHNIDLLVFFFVLCHLLIKIEDKKNAQRLQALPMCNGKIAKN